MCVHWVHVFELIWSWTSFPIPSNFPSYPLAWAVPALFDSLDIWLSYDLAASFGWLLLYKYVDPLFGPVCLFGIHCI